MDADEESCESLEDAVVLVLRYTSYSTSSKQQ